MRLIFLNPMAIVLINLVWISDFHGVKISLWCLNSEADKAYISKDFGFKMEYFVVMWEVKVESKDRI